MIRTPTDAIVTAMELADDMSEVIIVYKMKKDKDGKSGVGWITTIEDTTQKVGFLEESKMAIFGSAYGLRNDI